MDKRKKMKAKAAAGTALLLGMSTISGNLVHAMEQGEPVETGEVNEVEETKELSTDTLMPLSEASDGTDVTEELPQRNEQNEILINETNFPDAGVLQWIKNNQRTIDKDSNGALSDAELSAERTFNPDNTNVLNNLTNLKGLEYFTGVKVVSLFNNDKAAPNLTSLEGLKNMD